jgi:hypothetical protein
LDDLIARIDNIANEATALHYTLATDLEEFVVSAGVRAKRWMRGKSRFSAPGAN